VWQNQTTFGTSGTGKREFDSPTGVAIAPDGLTAWVADQGNHRVSIWANSGGVWDSINEFGSGSGSTDDQFDIPTGVAVSTDGKTAWVADSGNHRVSVWVISGIVWTNLTTFGTFGSGQARFNLPRGVAVSADGKTAWVADQGNHRISVWTNAGGGWNPLTTFGGFGSGLGQLNNPQAVAIAPDGLTAWVADSSNNRVSIWTNAGGTWTNAATFGTSGTGPSHFNNPRGVAVAGDGQTVWVVDGFNHRVSVWTNSGGTWTHLTTFGSGQGSGTNQFNLPFGVTVAGDGQTVWVADSSNDRISIWARTCPAV
jgi:tripartite motif-containing protein 71